MNSMGAIPEQNAIPEQYAGNSGPGFKIPLHPELRETMPNLADILESLGAVVVGQFFAAAKDRFTWTFGNIFCLDPNHRGILIEQMEVLEQFMQDHWTCERPRECEDAWHYERTTPGDACPECGDNTRWTGREFEAWDAGRKILGDGL